MQSEWQRNTVAGGLFSALTMKIWRFGVSAHSKSGPGRRTRLLIFRLVDTAWTKAIIGSDLPPNVSLGERIFLAHGGRGIFIAEGVSIGSDVTLHQQVTIGHSSRPNGVVPAIGDRVYIGAKASVIGGVTVGDDARIGAHALVARDVAAGSTVVGVPASPLESPSL